jgi:hypothetical protein
MHYGAASLIAIVFLSRTPPAFDGQLARQPQATVSAQRTSTSTVTVSIQNNSHSALEAWSVEVKYVAADGRQVTDTVSTDAYMSLAADRALADGPIVPGERRMINVNVWNLTELQSTRLSLALFSDMSFDGDKQRRAAVLARREADAAELTSWIELLKGAAALPPHRVKAELARGLTERRLKNAGHDANGWRDAAVTVEDAIKKADSRPGGLAQVIKDLSQLFDTQRELALRHKIVR